MKKTGFTLIELLAVIVILSFLGLITSLGVTKMIKNSKNKLYQDQVNSIISAAESWSVDNLYKMPSKGECSYITLKDLKNNGLIDDVIDARNKKNISDDFKIYITNEGTSKGDTNYKYNDEVDNPNECYYINSICKSVITSSAGKVAFGSFNLGDEYTCQVNDTTSYNFYVLSTSEDKVNLIMNKNICSDGSLANSSNTCLTYWGTFNSGPNEAISYLNQATSSWTNIPSLNETYNDENGRFTNFKITGKARLPKYSEVSATGCSDNSPGTCPEYMVNGLESYDTGKYPSKENIDNIDGYFTLASYPNSSSTSQESLAVFYPGLTTNVFANPNAAGSIGTGIRPVITLNKSDLSTVNYKGTVVKFNPLTAKTCSSGSDCYTWNIIGSKNGKVLMMMNENLGKDVYTRWGGDNANQNAPALIETLSSLTSSWDDSLTLKSGEATTKYLYKNGKEFITIDFNGLKARVISAEEVASLSYIDFTTLKQNDSGINDEYIELPSWLTQNIGDNFSLTFNGTSYIQQQGYWTLTPISTSDSYENKTAYMITKKGITSYYVGSGNPTEGGSVNYQAGFKFALGIRPVIAVTPDKLY